MLHLFTAEIYNSVLIVMGVLAVIVFIALQWIEAPYGMAFRKGWGPSVNNRVGWIAMEAPAFIAMLWFMLASPRLSVQTLASLSAFIPMLIALLFLFHYFQRSFIFPLLMRGKSRMPWTIALMGALFNIINAYMIGGWLFYLSPEDYYEPVAQLLCGDFSVAVTSPLPIAFVAGLLIFFLGMAINWQSDYIIRHLRKPGETGHKIPRGGMYDYVSSANYLGEIIEWCGFAIICWSWAGVMFLLWTCSNLVPRSAKIHQRYINEFGDEYRSLKRRRIFPFIY
jgi:3-oxo-5-alpha-steroid 4-dehydrogenase 1